MRLKLATTLIGLLGWLAAGAAHAQFPGTGGESSPVWACFYECKKGPDVQDERTFSEVTSLMITNQGRVSENVELFFLDGRENFIGNARLNLSTLDLDEVNVCHTLLRGDIQPPPAGLVQIVSIDGDPSGIKAWVKNVGGKFFYSNPEIFEGRVQGIGKTRCEPVPSPAVNDQGTIREAGLDSRQLEPILIEETDDPILPDLLPLRNPAVPSSYCRLNSQTGDLVVEIRNQGNGAAGATDTIVNFPGFGTFSQGTAPLGPGASTILNFAIPLGCYNPDCDFSIRADGNDDEVESDEGNNAVSDLCLG